MSDLSSHSRPEGLDPEVDDKIEPFRIQHKIDEYRKDGELLHYYNYLSYEFERDALVLRARAYLNDIGKVSVFCPMVASGGAECVAAPRFQSDVFDYLKRRFNTIRRLGDHGYETVWTRETANP